MHRLAIDVRGLSSGTVSALMRQRNLDCFIDTSRYENIDRMHAAFIAFADSVIQCATDTNMDVRHRHWQDLWEVFVKSAFFYDGLGILQAEIPESVKP